MFCVINYNKIECEIIVFLGVILKIHIGEPISKRTISIQMNLSGTDKQQIYKYIYWFYILNYSFMVSVKIDMQGIYL